jgi:hypothetical protein
VESRLREKEAELAATQAQFAQLLADFKFNLKVRGARGARGATVRMQRAHTNINRATETLRGRSHASALRARACADARVARAVNLAVVQLLEERDAELSRGASAAAAARGETVARTGQAAAARDAAEADARRERARADAAEAALRCVARAWRLRAGRAHGWSDAADAGATLKLRRRPACALRCRSLSLFL